MNTNIERGVYSRLMQYIIAVLLAFLVGLAPMYSPVSRQGICYIHALVAGLVAALFLLRVLGLTRLLCVFAAFIWIQTGFVSRLFTPWLRWLSDQELGIYVAALIMLPSVVLSKRLGKRTSLSFPLSKPLLFFLAGGVLAFLFGAAPDREDALYFLRIGCVYSLAVYFVAANQFRESRQVEQMFMMLCLGGCILGVLAYLGFLQSDVPAQRLGDARVALTGSFVLAIGPASLSNYLAFLLPLSFAQALNGDGRWQRLVSFVVCVVLVISLVLSGGRGAWVSAALGCVLILFFSLKYQMRKATDLPRLVFALAVLGLVAHLVFGRGLVPLTSEVRYRMMSLSAPTTDPSWMARVVRWGIGLQLFREYPLGTGFVFLLPGGFNPHSLYIGLALGVGILGLSGFLCFLVMWFWKSVAVLPFGNLSYRSMCIGAVGSVVAALVSGFGHDLNLITWHFAALWLVLGAVMGVAQATINEASNR